MLFRLMAILGAALIAAAGDAKAATTIYPSSIFGNSGVAGAGGLIGNTPSVTQIDRNDSIGIAFSQPITNYSLTFNIASVTPQTTYLWVRFGRFQSGAFTSAPVSGLLAPNGAGTQNLYIQVSGAGAYVVNSLAYSAGCSTIGGCNAFAFGNSTFSAAGSRFGVSTVGATPEPDAWALMIIGFVGVAWRLKSARRGRGAARRPAPADLFPAKMIKPQILGELASNS